MRQVTKWITFSAVGLILTGCVSLPSTNNQAIDYSYYLIDTKRGELCRGNSRECISLSIVASQNGLVSPIESAYKQKVTAPNYPRSLLTMLLNPKDKSYTAKRVENNGRFYQIPKERKTDIAWRTLKGLYTNIYE